VRVLLPITREDGLLDWAVGDGKSETEGLAGMPEVVGEVLSPLAINDVDAILTLSLELMKL
jgi:5-formyltetrahydrofolate cyclo-ligase